MRKSDEAFELKNVRERIIRKYNKNFIEPFNVIIPKSINNGLIESFRPNEVTDPVYWKDCVFYLIHTIFTKTINEDFKTGPSKFVALKYAELKKVLGAHVTIVLATLEKEKIIFKDKKYQMNVTSFGYKINKNQLKNFEFEYKTITSQKVCNRLNKYQLEYFENQKPLLSKYAHLIKWFLDNKLVYNESKGNLFFLALEEALTTMLEELPFSKGEKKKIITKINWIQTKNNLAIYKGLPVVSSNGERLYSELTAMYSPLRNFLTYDGFNLIYLDISNSQPFHFNILLRSSFWEKNSKGITLRKIDKELYEWIVKYHKVQLDVTIMNLKRYEQEGRTHTNKGLLRNKDASPQYVHLSATGKLYLFIHKKFKNNFFSKDNVDRFKDEKSAKQEFIQMLYFNDKIRQSPSYRPFQLFKRYFNIEASVIELLKLRKYNDFSILLQKVEANLLLYQVGREIFNTDPNAPIFTIHDGLITTTFYEDLLREKINLVYTNTLGFAPDLKKEILSEKITLTEFRKAVEKKMNQILKDLSLKEIKYTPEIGLKISLAYIKYLK